MAYTIQFQSGQFEKRDRVFSYLQERIIKEGRFRATLIVGHKYGILPSIVIKPVRLVKAKEYCGNHPGECVIPPHGSKKKHVATYLEWEDWVAFNGMVNRVLNRFRANADVWSTPADVRGKMWVRKGLKARKRYDWEDKFLPGRSVPVRVWNQGDDSQF